MASRCVLERDVQRCFGGHLKAHKGRRNKEFTQVFDDEMNGLRSSTIPFIKSSLFWSVSIKTELLSYYFGSSF